MTTMISALPDVTHPEVRLVLTSELAVSDPAHQRPSADAMLDSFDHSPWPEGLISHTVLLGTDGVSLQHYAQWTGVEAYEVFQREDPPARLAAIRGVTPDLERVRGGPYVLYRSMDSESDATPGCIVIIDVEFEGPDPRRQRDWVDAVFDAVEGTEGDAPGGLAGQFHLSMDGTRVINYAEWVDEAAHIAALAPHDGRSVGGGPLWNRVQTFPGLKASLVKRFLPYRSVAR